MPNTSASRFLSVVEGQYKCPMTNALLLLSSD
jgi:hypothetical protein